MSRNSQEASRTIQDLFSLNGRVALVTGGAGRVGTQICRGLAEAGALVLVASRRLEACQDAAVELQREGWSAAAMMLDLADAESVQQVAARIRAERGRLDILVNNAATASPGGFDTYTDEAWQRAMTADGLGLLRVCRACSELLPPGGSIVNISSIYGVMSPDFRIYEGHPEMISSPGYAFLKGGMLQLTRYLSVYLAPRGIRVNCVSPGGVRSETMPPEFVERYSRRVPMGRLAGTNDVKGAVVFLASDAAGYITGQNLLVDGGLSAL